MKVMRRSGVKLGLPFTLMVMLIASMWGCSGSGGGPGDYDEPSTTANAPLAGQTSRVLIDAAALADWIDRGLVNNDDTYDKVVILDVTTAAKYAAGHIPGAQLWDSSAQTQTRIEGPAESINMVLDGASMDAMIQAHGIDENTTIVITTSASSSNTSPSRAYFLFRYWGWSQNRLKVLNGYNGAWTAAGKALVTTGTVVTASDYSVRDNGSFNPDERISLSELIVALNNDVGLPVDMRPGDNSDAGSTGGVFTEDEDGNAIPDPANSGGDYVVFEGSLRDGKAFSFAGFTNADGTFKPVESDEEETIADLLLAAGIDGSELIYSYCRTGIIASTGYFVLDAILGWDVMLYDGSWSQWGQLSADAARGGELPAGSLWATDNFELMDVINYNLDAGFTIEVLEVDDQALMNYPDPSLPAANRIENEDALYMESGGGGDGGGGAAPGYGN